MPSRSAAEKWLAELTNLPTASGHEDAVVDWVQRWVGRRPDLRLVRDSGGNILITQKGRKIRHPVVAVAHMDHPAFVAISSDGREVSFEFRGGVNPEYFEAARVRFQRADAVGRVRSYDPGEQTGIIEMAKPGLVDEGDIGMWVFRSQRARKGRFLAPACDDLAGAAAALAALDNARGRSGLRHFGVLLTRAEEMGFVGAIHAAKTATLDKESRVISIETSRASATAPIGAGPVIRIGDAITVFDAELTNRIARAVASQGLIHQRKLMDGGGCEATAFGVFGYRATGLCLALGNWHNRGNLDEFEAGTGQPVPKMEEISLDDYHGLIDLLLVAAAAADQPDDLVARFDILYEETRSVLE